MRMLLRSLILLIPACMLLVGAVTLFSRSRTAWLFLQLISGAGVAIVAIAHLFEALNILPWMEWGRANSAGHYLDLLGAVLGIVFFPIGYVLHALTGRKVESRVNRTETIGTDSA